MLYFDQCSHCSLRPAAVSNRFDQSLVNTIFEAVDCLQTQLMDYVLAETSLRRLNPSLPHSTLIHPDSETHHSVHIRLAYDPEVRINRNFTKPSFVRRRASSTARSGLSRRRRSCGTTGGRAHDPRSSSQLRGERRLRPSTLVNGMRGGCMSLTTARFAYAGGLARPFRTFAPRSNHHPLRFLALKFGSILAQCGHVHCVHRPYLPPRDCSVQCVSLRLKHTNCLLCVIVFDVGVPSQVLRAAHRTSSWNESSSNAGHPLDRPPPIPPSTVHPRPLPSCAQPSSKVSVVGVTEMVTMCVPTGLSSMSASKARLSSATWRTCACER